MMSRKLPEVCEIQYGFPFDSSLFSAEGDLPLIRIRDVVRGYTETYTSEKCDVAYLVHEGDILVGMDGVFNVAKWKGEPAYLNQRVCRIIPNETIDADFLFYFIPTALKKIENETAFVTVKHLKAKQLNAVVVPDVPIEEQKKIAAQLNVITDLIFLRQRQAEKLDELVKARFVEMFGDPVRNTKQFPLVELQDLYDVSSSKRVYQDEMVLDGIPFLRISDIVEKSTNDKCTPQCFISQEMYDQLSQKGLTPNVGDILVTSRGTLGLCYEVKPGEKFYFQDGMISWLYNRKDCVINTYLLYAFRMPGIRKQIDGSNDGSTVSYLSIARLKRLKIELPPLALQTEFSHFVHEVDREKERIQRSAALLETLKRSLMQQYFG